MVHKGGEDSEIFKKLSTCFIDFPIYFSENVLKHANMYIFFKLIYSTLGNTGPKVPLHLKIIHGCCGFIFFQPIL